MRYFRLHREFIYTQGNTESLIYNLLSGNKYILNKSESNIVSLLESNMDINSVINISNEETTLKLINFLQDNNIGQFYNNKVVIDKIRTTNSTILKYDKLIPFRLNRAVLELTGACNIKCKFCTEDNVIYRSCGCKLWPNKNNLNRTQWIDIINQLLKLGVKEIMFSGGEPFLQWPLLKDLIDILSKYNISITIFTNGTLLSQPICEYLHKKNVTLALQILGHNEDIYYKTTNQINIFKKLEFGLLLIDKYNINHTVSIIVSNLNDNHIDKIKNFIGKRLYQLIYLYPTNLYSSINFLENMNNELERELKIDIYSYQIVKKYNNCLYNQVFISNSGTVFPCMMLRDFKIGELTKEKLWTIFHQKRHKKFWELSKTKINNCKNCERNLICFDCRALDYYASNDLLGMKYCSKITTEEMNL